MLGHHGVDPEVDGTCNTQKTDRPSVQSKPVQFVLTGIFGSESVLVEDLALLEEESTINHTGGYARSGSNSSVVGLTEKFGGTPASLRSRKVDAPPMKKSVSCDLVWHERVRQSL